MTTPPTTDELCWDDRGLVPAVAQNAVTGELLMLAWMNAEALAETRRTGLAHFHSRSRAALWKKGETSGNTLAVREIRIDCDADAVLLLCEPAGPACHTGQRSCFFRPLAGEEDDGPPGSILDRLSAILAERRDSASAEESYTRSLLRGGFEKILAKIAEEHQELADELPDGEAGAVIHEAADLLFHVMVGLCARGVSSAELLAELARRFGVSGHAEKASR
jgi:phosphoribosyl-AMP cyclohydrolase / phosphoribosyl-ATP pyrophosphohydrolase